MEFMKLVLYNQRQLIGEDQLWQEQWFLRERIDHSLDFYNIYAFYVCRINETERQWSLYREVKVVVLLTYNDVTQHFFAK